MALALSQPAQTAGGFERTIVPIGKGAPIVPIVPKGPVVPFRKCVPGPKVTGFKSAAKWMAMKKKKKNPLGFKSEAKWMAMKTKKNTKTEKHGPMHQYARGENRGRQTR